MVLLFKGVPDLVRYIEYYLLLGATHVVAIDNNCDTVPHMRASTMLQPYLQGGIVTHFTQLRCHAFTANFTGQHARAIGREAVPRALQRDDTLLLVLDDDEFVVVNDTQANLRDVARTMRKSGTCALSVGWKQYGTGGHRCHPKGGLLANFLLRAPAKREVSTEEAAQAVADAKRNGLNPPFGFGKPLVLWEWRTTCKVHSCSCGGATGSSSIVEGRSREQSWTLHPAESQNAPHAAAISRQHSTHPATADSSLWIAHYAFQSEQHWEWKKSGGGRGDTLHSRLIRGNPPPFYNRIYDDHARTMHGWRIQMMSAKHRSLGECMMKQQA